MGCVYHTYLDTYRAVADCATRGVRLNDLRALGKSLEGARVDVARLAVNDALDHIPTRSRVHICRLRLVPTCAMCMSGVAPVSFDRSPGQSPRARVFLSVEPDGIQTG
ncbi:MAG: hypothetical protein A2V77_05430 [Anaeromyxobacter sp. RBG_16_69_14]|nr:MAG: hypothetical protein A2V77_05430 [Anaeromyxobacter sp. RBG_16_69_14]